MCDPFSFASAGQDLLAGISGAAEARSVGSFEAAQIEAMSILASGQSSLEQGALLREFTEATRQNAAAIAVSGLSKKSFESIARGNIEDLFRNLEAIDTNRRIGQIGRNTQKAAALLDAKMKASAALFSGAFSAADTLFEAEKTFQKANTGESRFGFFKKAIT